MSCWTSARSVALSLLLVASLSASAAQHAYAGLFSKIFRDAAESAGKGGKLPDKLIDLDVPRDVARVVNGLPTGRKNRALISQATPEGHVRLTNLKGETVTASSTKEIDAALRWLLPEASDAGRKNVDFYFDTSALAAGRPALNTLPRSGRAHVIHKDKSYAIVGQPPFESKALRVRLRPNVVVRASSAAAFREAAWQVNQPLKPSQIRVLSLDPDTTSPLQPARVSTDTTAPVIEAANPYALAKSMRGLSRQTVVLSGTVEGKVLFFTPSSGKRQSVLLADLRASAMRDDVNLIILDTDSTRQPGVRNLLWQKTEVGGLDTALKSATVGDFWSALVPRRAPLELEVSPSGKTQVAISATPRAELSRKLPDDDNSLISTTGKLLEDAVASVAGNIVTNSLETSVRSRQRQEELDLRIVPFLPAMPQILYIVAFIAGFGGLATIKSWWRKVWPLRQRAAFASTLGWLGNRLARGVPFFFVFMPLVAFIATPYQMVRGPVVLVWRIVSAPFRWIIGMFRTA